VLLEAEHGMDGVEALCRMLRAHPRLGSSTPVLVVSAGAISRADRLAAMRAGAWDAFGFPLDPEELVLKVRALASVRREVVEAEERGLLHRLGGRAVITPHAGEMAAVMGMEKEEVEADPLAVARRAAEELGAAVALKGPDTVIAAPDGRAYRYSGGRVGLATSGSGDVLAGLIAGLLARGAEPVAAAACGVWLHGEAGNALARRVGPIGFLARELPAEVPRLLARMA